MTVQIFVRDQSGHKIGEIDDWQSLSVTLKWADVGQWEFTTVPSKTVELLSQDNMGLVIERDGSILIAGPVDRFVPSYRDGRITITFSGFDDTCWLAARWAQPSYPPYTSAANDVQTGDAETVMKHYVEVNLGPSAVAARRLPNLVIATNYHRGPTITASARFDMVNTILTTCANSAGDMGFSISQGLAGHAISDLVFDVAQRRDMSNLVRFSVELGNLAEYDFERSRPTANAVLAGDQGDGIARQFVERTSADSLASWGRIEGPLVDRNDTTDLGLLAQSGDEALASSASKQTISTTTVSTGAVAFGRDWQLGDIVTVDFYGLSIVDTIREVDLSWAQDQAESIHPVIGTPDTPRPGMPQIFGNQRKLAKRVAQLEGRR